MLMKTPESLYPLAPRSKARKNYFGTNVKDPFHYMKNLEDARTTDWLAAQKKFTASYFANLSRQRKLTMERLLKLWRYPIYSVFAKEGSNYFFWGLGLNSQAEVQNQSVLYRLDNLAASPVPVIDLNLLDDGGKSAVTYQSISRDGQMVAYAISKDGSDWQTVRIRHALELFDYPEKVSSQKVGASTVNTSAV